MKNKKLNLRVETDSFGPIQVPADKYWGAQTQRSLDNFKIGNECLPRPLIRALGIVKRCSALSNIALDNIDKKIGFAIAAAAQMERHYQDRTNAFAGRDPAYPGSGVFRLHT